METLFVDRILACSDCNGEFIFTAGEQLFFHDKQFKNDPKRCKPCKSRRSGLAAAANGTGPAAAGISRTETRTECSECGIETTVPFKPTQGRPVLCRQCFQAKSRTPKTPALPLAAAPLYAAPPSESETIYALTAASTNSQGQTLSVEAAILAAASMASASSASSIATAADLASITPAEPEDEASTAAPADLPTGVHTVKMVSEMVSAEMVAAAAEAPEA